ncbi:MAG: transcription antitermination factor NusB [Gemmatimonadota bacterium]
MSRSFASERERIDRVRARAWALQILYRWESMGEGGSVRDALVETTSTRRISPRRLPYVRTVLKATETHLDEVDEWLRQALDNWRLDRLAVLDRALLRLAATEMIFLDDIPPRVSIQEAVRLAEQYGGPESPRFVNGVLDALYRRLAPADG